MRLDAVITVIPCTQTCQKVLIFSYQYIMLAQLSQRVFQSTLRSVHANDIAVFKNDFMKCFGHHPVPSVAGVPGCHVDGDDNDRHHQSYPEEYPVNDGGHGLPLILDLLLPLLVTHVAGQILQVLVNALQLLYHALCLTNIPVHFAFHVSHWYGFIIWSLLDKTILKYCQRAWSFSQPRSPWIFSSGTALRMPARQLRNT